MRLKSVFLPALVVVWISALVVGFWRLSTYENKPGRAASAPQQWPVSAKLGLNSNTLTLVMLVHPKCPCTRASIAELARLLARGHGKIRAYVLILSPREFSMDWAKTDLWSSASAIPDTTVLIDPDGQVAQVFGATTSGQTLVYEPGGRLVFSGGLTASRGHSGDNLGEDAIVDIVNGRKTDVRNTRVFGCPLVFERT
jgi:hypothetical protein